MRPRARSFANAVKVSKKDATSELAITYVVDGSTEIEENCLSEPRTIDMLVFSELFVDNQGNAINQRASGTE